MLRATKLGALMLAGALILPAPALAFPPNDAFASATPVTSLPFQSSPSGPLSVEPFEPGTAGLCGSRVTGSVWYRYTPSARIRVHASAPSNGASAAGREFIAFYTGSSLAGLQLKMSGCGNWGDDGTRAPIWLDGGITYHIQVGHLGGGNAPGGFDMVDLAIESQPYLATNVVTYCPMDLGGICFPTGSGDMSVDIVVGDAVAPAVGVNYFLYDGGGIFASGTFCRARTGISLQRPNAQIMISPGDGTRLACGTQASGLATFGTIWVTYRDTFAGAPPTEPRALTASPGTIPGSVALRWLSPVTTGRDPGGYRIYRTPEGGSEVVAGQTTDLSFTDRGCPTAECTYAVSALNADGEGPRSNAVRGMTSAPHPGATRHVGGAVLMPDGRLLALAVTALIDQQIASEAGAGVYEIDSPLGYHGTFVVQCARFVGTLADWTLYVRGRANPLGPDHYLTVRSIDRTYHSAIDRNSVSLPSGGCRAPSASTTFVAGALYVT